MGMDSAVLSSNLETQMNINPRRLSPRRAPTRT
jgi:hypothetical protein